MKMWNASEEAQYKVQGIMLNLDNTAHGVSGATTEEDLVAWANQFKGTHVTDIVMNIAESASMFPSRFGWYGDKYNQTVENGHPVDYSKGLPKNLYEHFIVNKQDYLKTLTKALPEAGINMWMSIRMNDAHDRGNPTSVLFTDFYHEHPEYRRVQYKTKHEGAMAYVYDYGYETIRNKYLDLIDETLERYDVYGFQLEWQRNMWVWKIGHEYLGVEIMNQFMRDAKAIVTKYEEKYGHKIMFSVQVAPDPQVNYDFGFDVVRWAREGIIDMVVPKGRWATTCNEIPVAYWKSLVESYGVQVVPDIEHRVICSGKPANCFHDIETYAGTAALYLSQGADKVQIYNILVPIRHVFRDEDKIAEYDPMIPMPEWPAGEKPSVPGWWLVFTTIGSYDKLMTMNRKVVSTYNDTLPPWRKRDAILPRTIQTDDSVFMLRIGMGDVPQGAKVTFRMASDVVDGDNPPAVFANGEAAKFVGTADAPEAPENQFYPGARRTENRFYCYEIPETVNNTMFAVVEVQGPNIVGSDEIKVKMTVDYAEIYIEPAK